MAEQGEGEENQAELKEDGAKEPGTATEEKGGRAVPSGDGKNEGEKQGVQYEKACLTECAKEVGSFGSGRFDVGGFGF